MLTRGPARPAGSRRQRVRGPAADSLLLCLLLTLSSRAKGGHLHAAGQPQSQGVLCREPRHERLRRVISAPPRPVPGGRFQASDAPSAGARSSPCIARAYRVVQGREAFACHPTVGVEADKATKVPLLLSRVYVAGTESRSMPRTPSTAKWRRMASSASRRCGSPLPRFVQCARFVVGALTKRGASRSRRGHRRGTPCTRRG
jgi:hypothetical protein